ncbi:MAG: hypothetical protein ACOC16_03775 [Nanoarchaeota archaeon]
MEKLKQTKKGQALPLNTIVIAILVIIVLLVIIFFFVSNMGESGETVDSLKGCDMNNPMITGAGYTDVESEVIPKNEDGSFDIKCSEEGWSKVPFISQVVKEKDEDGEATHYEICCGKK